MKGITLVILVCSIYQALSQEVLDSTLIPEEDTYPYVEPSSAKPVIQETTTPRTNPTTAKTSSSSSASTTKLASTSAPASNSTVASLTHQSSVKIEDRVGTAVIKETEVLKNQTRPKKEVSTLLAAQTDDLSPELRYRLDDDPKPVLYHHYPSEIPKPLTTRTPPARSPAEQLHLDSARYEQPIRTQPFGVRLTTPEKSFSSQQEKTTQKSIPQYALSDQHRVPLSALGDKHRIPLTELGDQLRVQNGASGEQHRLTAGDDLQAIVQQDAYSFAKPGSRWEKERNGVRKMNMTRVNHLEAQCQDDFMKIRVNFNGTFSGMIYSAGYAYDASCVYINGTGRDWYEFYIQLNRCGTLGGNNHNLDSRKQPTKNFMWNTVTIQYNSLIEEEWDEHFKVTCEYGYDFWKTISFPFLDVEVATGNPVVFTLAPPECHMEIRQGYGTAGPRVTGPVRVGDPLTLMLYMRSQYDGFDIVVSDCYAHNGGSKRIQLIDHNGCPVDEKIISSFRGTWSDSGVFETQVFAYMKTFRFTGSPALYLECDVRMCHGRCPNQACHWRGAKEIVKRSIDGVKENRTNTASETLNLYQALQVVGDSEVADEQKAEQEDSESICLAPAKVGLAIGAMFIVLLLFGTISVVSCLRMRRLQTTLKRSSADNFYQGYNHSDFHSFSKTVHSQTRQ